MSLMVSFVSAVVDLSAVLELTAYSAQTNEFVPSLKDLYNEVLDPCHCKMV